MQDGELAYAAFTQYGLFRTIDGLGGSGSGTVAMHLLQAGVEINVIRAWLGHVSVATTSQYIEIDMKMKQEALKRCEPLVPTSVRGAPWRLREDLIQWLHDL